MKVTLTESGGWTNVRRRCSVDTATLPRDAAARLEACMTALLGAEERAASRAIDAQLLVFEVEDRTGCKRVSFSEAKPPAEIVPVMEILRPLCRPVINVRG